MGVNTGGNGNGSPMTFFYVQWKLSEETLITDLFTAKTLYDIKH